MAFSTWTTLKTSMLNDLASGSWKIKSYQLGADGPATTYRSWDDFKQALEYVSSKAGEESSSTVGRTYAYQKGGLRW